jgi:DNA-binding CsgD family transcriptional regulator/PAS domain-containing protein
LQKTRDQCITSLGAKTEVHLLDSQVFAKLNNAISCFYDAALGKVSWEEPLRLAADAMNAHNAVFSVRDPVTRKAHFSFGNFGTDPTFTQSFAQTYATLSPFVIATAISPEGKAVNPINLIGREDYERGRFYKEWSAPQRYHDYVGSILLRQPNAIYTIAFGRTTERPLFSKTDMETLEFMTPHVTRALQFSERLNTFETERAELLSTLDSLATPIFLLDRNLRIRQINTAGLALIDSEQGVTNRNGTLSFTDSVVEQEFRSQRTIETGHAVVLQEKLKGGLQVQMLARNIEGPSHAANDERILVVIDRPTPSMAPVAENICERFGISIAELRVLLLLVDGKTTEIIAADLGLAKNTVKTHIAHLLQKTGTHSQIELLATVSKAGQETVTRLLSPAISQ